ELPLRHFQQMPDRREKKKRDGIQYENRSERNGHLFIVRIDSRPDRRDRTSTADRRSRRYQRRCLFRNLKKFSREISQNERAEYRCDRECDAVLSGSENGGNIHSETEQNDRSLQQIFCWFSGCSWKRIADRESHRHTKRQCERCRTVR